MMNYVIKMNYSGEYFYKIIDLKKIQKKLFLLHTPPDG